MYFKIGKLPNKILILIYKHEIWLTSPIIPLMSYLVALMLAPICSVGFTNFIKCNVIIFGSYLVRYINLWNYILFRLIFVFTRSYDIDVNV